MPEQPDRTPEVAANGVLTFVLEVGLYGAAALWALQTFPAFGIAAAAAACVVLVVFWMLFMSPRASRRIKWPIQPVLALLLFLAASFALITLGHPVLGTVFAALAIANAVLNLRTRPPMTTAAARVRRPRKR